MYTLIRKSSLIWVRNVCSTIQIAFKRAEVKKSDLDSDRKSMYMYGGGQFWQVHSVLIIGRNLVSIGTYV